MAAQCTSAGKKAYAKDSTWAGSAQAEADGWRRSPEEWTKSAAAAYKAVGAIHKDMPEAVDREREEDMELIMGPR